MKLNELINKRILVRKISTSSYTPAEVEEITIVEVSPSNNWVKIKNQNGNKFWKPIQSIALIEVLQEIEK